MTCLVAASLGDWKNYFDWGPFTYTTTYSLPQNNNEITDQLSDFSCSKKEKYKWYNLWLVSLNLENMKALVNPESANYRY